MMPRDGTLETSLDLFRAEALAGRRGELSGIVEVPRFWSVATLFCLGLVVGAVIFGALVTVPRVENGRGRLVSSTGEVRVNARVSGTVEALNFRDGDHVQAGQILAVINTDAVSATGHRESARSQQLLGDERRNLDERRSSLENEREMRDAVFTRKREAIQRRQGEMVRFRELLSRNLELARERSRSGQELASKGLLSRDRLRDREEREIELELRLAQSEAESRQLDDQLQSTVDEHEILAANFLLRNLEIERGLTDLEARTQSADLGARYAVMAPSAGRIAQQSIKLGDAVVVQQPILVLLPDGGEVEAEIFLPSRAVGFLEVGQRVKLQVDAFPYQKFGLVDAEVRFISLTALSPNEIPYADYGTEPVYRVLASLQTQKSSRRLPLRNGMEFTVRIVLEARTLLEWVFEPVARMVPPDLVPE